MVQQYKLVCQNILRYGTKDVYIHLAKLPRTWIDGVGEFHFVDTNGLLRLACKHKFRISDKIPATFPSQVTGTPACLRSMETISVIS